MTRIQHLQSYLDRHHLDAIILTFPKHIYYFTNFACDPHERLLALLLLQGEEPKLLVPELDAEKAATEANGINIQTYQDEEQPDEVLARHLPRQLQTVAVEKSHLNVNRFQMFQGIMPDAEFRDIGEQLQEMRLVKTQFEIERIASAIQIVEDVLQAGVSKVKPGVTEIELVAELEYQMKKRGAQGPSFSTMVLTGPKSAQPHGIPGQRKVAEGEVILFDLGVYAAGYASDITRTFAVGEVSAEVRRIYDTVLLANEVAIQSTKPGVQLKHLDHMARKLIAKAGYGAFFNHRLGHGLGLDVHEYPSLHGKNEEKIVPNMVFTIEPGIYMPDLAGVRIEDDVLVTPQGVTVLTHYPKEFTTIGC